MKKELILLLFITTGCFAQQTIETMFTPPNGYERIYQDGYSQFLRQFPLKENNVVKYYNGEEKFNDNIWAAVYDYEIGTEDLHQCADAVLYMRANYLFTNGIKDQLYYNFVSGYNAKYNDWLSHYYKIRGSSVSLEPRTNPLEDNLETFAKWIRQIWMYANTWSIDTYNSDSVAIKDMKPGDFFIQSNPPPAVGHAINIVDVAVNQGTGEKVFMLSQSFMPAQQTHILLNSETGGVWYSLNEFNDIETPEWMFTVNELKRFKN